MKLAIALVLLLASTARADDLLGVAADGSRAWVLHGEAVETIDVATGHVLGSESGFAAIAGAIARGGAWNARWTETAVSPSAAGVVAPYATAIVVMTTDGTGGDVLETGEPTHIHVSPDGTRVLWEEHRLGGPSHALHVSAARRGAPDRAVPLDELYSAWQWTPDGGAILGYRMFGCLERFDIATLAARELACDLSQAVMDPTGATIALTDTSGTMRWIDAGTGAERARWSPAWWNDSTSDLARETLSPTGLFVTLSRDERTLYAIDLASGRTASIAAHGGTFAGLDTTRWIGESIVVLERSGGAKRPHRVDVRAALR